MLLVAIFFILLQMCVLIRNLLAMWQFLNNSLLGLLDTPELQTLKMDVDELTLLLL